LVSKYHPNTTSLSNNQTLLYIRIFVASTVYNFSFNFQGVKGSDGAIFSAKYNKIRNMNLTSTENVILAENKISLLLTLDYWKHCQL
jgi:hypothetical protein